MFISPNEIKTQLDTIDALNEVSSALTGLGFICISLCESSSYAEEDTFGLLADIAYHYAAISKKVSSIICSNYEKKPDVSTIHNPNAMDKTECSAQDTPCAA